jgi:uncharacterized protein
LLRAKIGCNLRTYKIIAGCSQIQRKQSGENGWLSPFSRFQESGKDGMGGKDMNYYLLIYHVVDDYVLRRAPYREEHIQLARDAYARGELILGGALADPVDQAILVFRSPDKSAIEEFVGNDPYVKNGLVRRWEIRLWSVVIGNK